MKPGNKLPLIAAVAIVVAVVAGTFLLRGPGRADVESQAADGSIAPLDAAPQVQTAAPRPLRQATAATTGRSAEEAVIGHVERRAEMREEQAARTAAMKEQSAQRYASEQVDPAWAPAKVTELNTIAADPAFEAAGVAPADLSIDCRSSMCRIEGQFADAGQAEDWIMLYNASVGGAMPSAVVSRSRNPDGTMRVEIYGRGR